MLARAWCRAAALVALAAVTCMPFAWAAADAPSGRTYRLELKKMDGIEHGKTAVVKGEAGSQPHRFLVDGLNMNMPVTVLLRPVRENDAVTLRLTKYAWNQPLREGTAKGEPIGFKFRTEGEFQIAVSAEKPTPYRLLVWTGEETKPELRPVVIKASEYERASSEGGSALVLWVIAGALVVTAALLAMLVLRRKAS